MKILFAGFSAIGRTAFNRTIVELKRVSIAGNKDHRNLFCTDVTETLLKNIRASGISFPIAS